MVSKESHTTNIPDSNVLKWHGNPVLNKGKNDHGESQDDNSVSTYVKDAYNVIFSPEFRC